METGSIIHKRRSSRHHALKNLRDNNESQAYEEVGISASWVCSQITGKHILCIGHTPPMTSIQLARKGSAVTVIDSRAEIIAQARNELAQASSAIQRKAKYHETDFMAWEPGETRPDTIVIGEMPELADQLEAVIRKAAGLLKWNGKLILTVPLGIAAGQNEYAHYLLKPFNVLSQWLNVIEIEIQKNGLGLAAIKPADTVNREKNVITHEQIGALEQAFAQIERSWLNKVTALTDELRHHSDAAPAVATTVQRLKDELQQEKEKNQKRDEASEHKQLKLSIQIGELNERLKTAESTLQKAQKAQEQHLKKNQQLQRVRQENEIKHRNALNQIEELKRQLKKSEISNRSFEKQNGLQNEQLLLQQKQLVAQTQALIERENSLLALKQDNVRLQADLNALRDQFERQQADLSKARTNSQTLQSRLNETEQARTTLDANLADLKSKLDNANQKYRLLTSEQIPHYKSKTAAQIKTIEELQNSLCHAEAKCNLLEQRLIKTRASLTYQLGYQLKSSASLSGLVQLPKGLIHLYKQAKQRKTLFEQTPAALVQLSALQPPHQPVSSPEPLDNAKEAREHLLIPAHHRARSLKVACILDDFTQSALRFECQLMQLTPGQYASELKSFQPELLFIESAWCGKDNLWSGKVGHNSQELQNILAWCQERRIPTLFWNKEDPVHFETFLTTARQFDFVFTTDFDCIHRYKEALRHDRIYFLPFACQPAIHNPIELYQRKDAFCFAGAYYRGYPERTRDLGHFIMELPKFRPVEIYDRNYGKDDVKYQFPEEYHPYILGTLPPDQIDKAYKGYRYSINLNSIKASQTMFARRIYELLGSNTITVSNFSRGLRILFGDLVFTTDSSTEMLQRLQRTASDQEYTDKLRLAALRKIMQEHTYGHRMDYLLSKVHGTQIAPEQPSIAVIALANHPDQIDQLQGHLARQNYPHVTMHIFCTNKKTAQHTVSDPRITLLNARTNSTATLAAFTQGSQWVAGMLAADYYGPNYLLDMVLAPTYSRAEIIGKSAIYEKTWQGITYQERNGAYQLQPNGILARSAMIAAHLVEQSNALTWAKTIADQVLDHGIGLSIDPFNYCRNADERTDPTALQRVNDIDIDCGISIDALQQEAETIQPASEQKKDNTAWDVTQLQQVFGKIGTKLVQLSVVDNNWQIISNLEDGKHDYLYAAHELPVKQLSADDRLKLFLDVTPGLNIQLVVLFLDAQKQRISHAMFYANRNETAIIPPETTFIRLGLRIYAGGTASIKSLVLGHRNLQPPQMLSRAQHLLVTNHYPSDSDLYRNGFVHSRVKNYRQAGLRMDVFRLQKNETISYHEFENIDVTTGGQEILEHMLKRNHYRSVLVHFLDPDMWDVLSRYIDRIPILVWVHGSEIQPWWRRQFNYETDDQLRLAKQLSKARMTFWQNILRPMPKNLKLLFVSNHFAEEIMKDLGFRIPDDQYAVIHNPIDTDLFSYQEKPVEQRKRILSIRPYTSRTYANDLTVKAIERLSVKPWFQELEFRIIGDGPLFEETVEPLKAFDNVIIERGFLKQSDIANLHKDYGVFLCPTRMDSQGVSRDEAMSSGLVPITNAVAAVPEFVDSECGFLCDEESYIGLSDSIECLYHSPESFASQSAQAALRVRRQSNKTLMLDKETQLIKSNVIE